MSVCSASSRLARIALAAAALLAIAVAPAAARVARHDSLRAVAGVRVSDDGIRITTGGSDSTTRSGRQRFGTTVDVGGQKVHVRGNVVDVTGDGKDVHVVGPVVLVNGQGADMVRVFSDAEVAAGERVEGDVVAVFGSVTVKGQVSGNVIAVFGSVHIDSSAVVDGDAVAVGGVLETQPGASVSGQSVSIESALDRHRLPSVILANPGVVVALIALLLLPVLGGWLFFLVAPDRMLRVAVTATHRPFLSLLLGLLAGPLAVVAAVLLLVTVVGIPIALLLPVLFGLLAWAGHVAATYVIGCRLIRRRLGERGTAGPYVAGTLFVAAFLVLGLAGLTLPGLFKPAAFFLLMLGVLLGAGLGIIGTGAALLSRLGSTPKDVTRRGLAAAGSSSAPLAGPAAPPAGA